MVSARLAMSYDLSYLMDINDHFSRVVKNSGLKHWKTGEIRQTVQYTMLQE
jgi:hypothetical protein